MNIMYKGEMILTLFKQKYGVLFLKDYLFVIYAAFLLFDIWKLNKKTCAYNRVYIEILMLI